MFLCTVSFIPSSDSDITGQCLAVNNKNWLSSLRNILYSWIYKALLISNIYRQRECRGQLSTTPTPPPPTHTQCCLFFLYQFWKIHKHRILPFVHLPRILIAQSINKEDSIIIDVIILGITVFRWITYAIYPRSWVLSKDSSHHKIPALTIH